MFYDLSKVLTHNSYINFLLGERGVGKTWALKRYCINNFLKKGEQFIYLRRYKTELKKVSAFFKDIQEFFPDHEFKVAGSTFIIDGKVAGYNFPLSTSLTLKSTPFPDVTTIVYDEFIIATGTYHYLNSECTAFLEFVETVFRLRDNGKIFMLANTLSAINPYFVYFNINQLPTPEKTIKTYKDNLILVEIMLNQEYREQKLKTQFGKLISGTEYGEYAINNEFLLDSDEFISKRPPNTKFLFAFSYQDKTFGVWIDYSKDEMYVSYKYDKNTSYIYSTTMNDHKVNTIYMKNVKSFGVWRHFINCYKFGLVYFENQEIKQICYKLISTLLF